MQWLDKNTVAEDSRLPDLRVNLPFLERGQTRILGQARIDLALRFKHYGPLSG